MWEGLYVWGTSRMYSVQYLLLRREDRDGFNHFHCFLELTLPVGVIRNEHGNLKQNIRIDLDNREPLVRQSLSTQVVEFCKEERYTINVRLQCIQLKSIGDLVSNC